MLRRATALVLAAGALALAAPPSPKEYFGYEPGEDFRLADYAEISGYFEKLSQTSDRIRWVEFGRTSLGRPMRLAILSDAANLKRLDEFQRWNRRLALGDATPEEAARLAAEGRAIVWIDSGLHSDEVAPAQHAPHLAYRMLADESPEVRRIRQNVILLQVPVINPDGLDMIAHWYRKNVKTPYELARLPQLYQKYAGHDNNRDWFMLNLPETRHVTRLLYEQWFPHIVYNQHQSPAFPARIFVPPYAEPLNPHIPAPVMEGINLIGSAIKERFARESKPGVLSYFGYDAWWNGGLRSTPAFHNMHGILTETAAYAYATPHEYKASELPERFGNGLPTREPSIFYQRPWHGGWWRLRDAIEYMLTADFAILDLASVRREFFLTKAWEQARANIEAGRAGKPFAYVVPLEQWDASSAAEMLWRLRKGGLQIQRARSAFQADGRSYPAGSYILPAAQPFRAYLVDLMEPQKYPEIRTGSSGPTKRPYDIAGWTLPMQMGVSVDRVEEAFGADTEPVDDISIQEPVLDRRQNSSFRAVSRLLAGGGKLRWGPGGEWLDQPGPAFDRATVEVQRPRVALYEPWVPNMDQGWTQWVFDTFEVPYTLVHNDDLQKNDLRSRFDTLVLASQTTESLLHGLRPGQTEPGESSSARRVPAVPRPEHTGGIGIEGVANLNRFVRGGGTLIALNAATEFATQFFGVPVRNVARSGEGGEAFYCPGSLLRISVDTSHPIGFGMPADSIAFSSGGYAFDITANGNDTRGVVRFAGSKLLASGWLSGERVVAGKHILVESKVGQGRIVLYGFRPQHRGQTFGTFKLLLNAVYLASAKRL